MGDRANVCFHDDGGQIYFYTHWSGSDLPGILQAALRTGQDRWDDPQYLARIIFCEMVRGSWSETTGYGISTKIGDGDDRVIHVYAEKQTITIKGREYTYQQYVEADVHW